MSSKVLNDVASHRKLCGRVEMARDVERIFAQGSLQGSYFGRNNFDLICRWEVVPLISVAVADEERPSNLPILGKRSRS